MQNFSVKSWNVQGLVNITGYTPFKKVKPYLKHSRSDIIVLQEMPNAEKILKDSFKEYAAYVPINNQVKKGGVSSYNYNVILSKYPILRSGEVVFPIWNKGASLENCSRADIQLPAKIIRIYNCHFGITNIGIKTRLKQLEYILSDARSHEGPVIVCGDMNVTVPKVGWKRKIISLWHNEPQYEMFVDGKFIDYDERELFNRTLTQYGFKESLDLHQTTWSPLKSKIWEMFNLKLDWFMVRDLGVTNISLSEYVSDHRAVDANIVV